MNKFTACAAASLGALAVAVFVSVAPAAEEDAVAIEVGKEALTFKINGEVVTRYHIAPSVAKPYFWPVLAPGNVPVTRAWPMSKDQEGDATDHPHQKSVWFCHGDVIPEGIEIKQKIRGITGVDFWSEANGHGVIACVEVGEPKSEKGHAWVVTKNEWRTADGVEILNETRTLHLYSINGGRLLVLDCLLKASVCPITFGDTKEGSMGVRVRTSLQADNKNMGTLVNAEGKTGEGAGGNKQKTGCWGLISAWCDDHGPADGKTVGLAVFADPANEVKSAWHARGYGLVAANPFGRSKAGFPDLAGKTDLVKLPRGGELRLRYGVFAHAGTTEDGKVAATYEAFAKLRK